MVIISGVPIFRIFTVNIYYFSYFLLLKAILNCVYRFKNSNHLMLNGNSKPHIRQRLTNFHLFLNHLHPGIFPDILSHTTHAEPSAPQTGRVIQGETGLRYNWFDESGFDW